MNVFIKCYTFGLQSKQLPSELSLRRQKMNQTKKQAHNTIINQSSDFKVKETGVFVCSAMYFRAILSFILLFQGPSFCFSLLSAALLALKVIYLSCILTKAYQFTVIKKKNHQCLTKEHSFEHMIFCPCTKFTLNTLMSSPLEPSVVLSIVFFFYSSLSQNGQELFMCHQVISTQEHLKFHVQFLLKAIFKLEL